MSRYSNIILETRLVPISELFSFESTLTMTQVLSATFSLNHSCARSRCRRFLVILFDCDAYTQAWLSPSIFVGSWVHPMAFKIARLEITSPFNVWLTALISDSAVDVDTLPWSGSTSIRLTFPSILYMMSGNGRCQGCLQGQRRIEIVAGGLRSLSLCP